MATHKQAWKRHKQSLKRRDNNLRVKTYLRTLTKRIEAALTEKKREEAQKILAQLAPAFEKAAGNHIIPAQRASRKISRLHLAINRLSA